MRWRRAALRLKGMAGVSGAASRASVAASGGGGLSDEVGQRRDGFGAGDAQSVPEVAVERDAELAAGPHQAEQDVAGGAPVLAHGAAADLPLGDAGPDVVLGAVGVQRDLRALEHAQQLGLAPAQ